jgi:hypothetical protein
MTHPDRPRGGPTGPAPDADRWRPVAPTAGPVLFARYAYPPNSLGYCGPGDPAALLGTAAEGSDLPALGHLAARFDGAWPYLQLIAACSGLADPLDRRVVEAYWVGNELLGTVSQATLAHALGDRFEQRAGRRFSSLVSSVPAGGIPQHSFHVFAVYPWLGLLRAGMEGPPLEVLDRCRIRWGRVEEVAGDMVTVLSRPLLFQGSRLALGPYRTEPVRRSLDGVGFTEDLRPGDVVSLHWDWVCDRLSPTGFAWLRYCTSRNLDAVNSLASPGPAVVTGA